jgi:AraC-like DNA-binding protein
LTVYAPVLGILWRTVESYHVDPGLAIDESLYRPDRKTLLVERIRFSDFDNALTRACKLVGDPAFGVRTAQFLHPSYFGALGHAWLVSLNLRSALKRLEQFQALLDENSNIRVRELPDRVQIAYRTVREQSCRDVLDDLHQAQLLAMCRLNFGAGFEPIEINLRRPAPPDPAPWFEFFGPIVKFAQPEVTLALSNKQADAPLPVANPELVALHDESIRRHLLKLNQNNILNLCRMRLADQLPSGRVTENDLAGALHMSTRTLHRKLRENDETFRSLLEKVRTDLAGRYIRNLNYNITEIAFLLGYTDISAFSRAFKGWFGRSPTEARGLH